MIAGMVDMSMSAYGKACAMLTVCDADTHNSNSTQLDAANVWSTATSNNLSASTPDLSSTSIHSPKSSTRTNKVKAERLPLAHHNARQGRHFRLTLSPVQLVPPVLAGA